ncbi:MAG: hypothetical protein K8T91_24975 [Planctomycetes bacterium]|nr:hypothetical protein [Planctomycetota bacterium]
MAQSDCDLIGGISGAELAVEQFDFGEGITISRTYAHLMAPIMMAFKRPEPGKAHPPPWMAENGGFGFDITIQLVVPRTFIFPNGFNRLNTIWWFAALIRLRAVPFALLPVVSSERFADAPNLSHEVDLWPMEVDTRRLKLIENANNIINEDDLDWIRVHWRHAASLMNQSSEFRLLVQAFDQSTFVRYPALAMVSLWGAIEGLFSPARAELRFRVSASIAAYLEPPSDRRLTLQKQVAKLYDARSVAAHGGSDISLDALCNTYALVRRLILAIIDKGRVPTREDLEVCLFVNRATNSSPI